jgi:CRISPR-associated protein Cas2
MVWRDKKAAGNLRIETLGERPKTIVDADGVLLVKRK